MRMDVCAQIPRADVVQTSWLGGPARPQASAVRKPTLGTQPQLHKNKTAISGSAKFDMVHKFAVVPPVMDQAGNPVAGRKSTMRCSKACWARRTSVSIGGER
jgi:hypothetical protein